MVSSVSTQIFKFISEKYSADNWGITLKEENILDLFPLERIVYLTGDAEE